MATLAAKCSLENEPLIEVASCAELDSAPMKVPLKSFAIIVALELILPLAVISPVIFKLSPKSIDSPPVTASKLSALTTPLAVTLPPTYK